VWCGRSKPQRAHGWRGVGNTGEEMHTIALSADDRARGGLDDALISGCFFLGIHGKSVLRRLPQAYLITTSAPTCHHFARRVLAECVQEPPVGDVPPLGTELIAVTGSAGPASCCIKPSAVPGLAMLA